MATWSSSLYLRSILSDLTGLDSVEEVVYEDDDLLVKLVKVPLVRCHFHSVTAILFLVGDLSLGVGTAVR